MSRDNVTHDQVIARIRKARRVDMIEELLILKEKVAGIAAELRKDQNLSTRNEWEALRVIDLSVADLWYAGSVLELDEIERD